MFLKKIFGFNKFNHLKKLVTLVILISTFYSLNISSATLPKNNQQNNENIDEGSDLLKIEQLSQNYEIANKARLVLINKITTGSKEIILKQGESVYFHNLQILLHKCLSSRNYYEPRSYALVTLTEHKYDDDASVVFSGWIISDNPALSSFEHSTYEIFIKSCEI